MESSPFTGSLAISGRPAATSSNDKYIVEVEILDGRQIDPENYKLKKMQYELWYMIQLKPWIAYILQ